MVILYVEIKGLHVTSPNLPYDQAQWPSLDSCEIKLDLTALEYALSRLPPVIERICYSAAIQWSEEGCR